jgi:Na+/H+ antiporter NhaD/arsenite permease-like protein
MDFVYNLAPAVIVIMAATMVPIWFFWGRKLGTTDEARAKVMNFDERQAITDPRLLKQSMFVLALVIAGFVTHHALGLQPATIAMSGAALLLLLDNLGHDAEHQSKNVHHTFGETEWITIFFFVGLFIAVYGIEQAGLIQWMADTLLGFTGGDLSRTALAILWGSAILSAFVDNIPFVATMIPLIKSMGPTLGGDQALMPLWWSLALGACLGGNGTLIGASANLVVAGFAERAGTPIRFLTFLRHSFALMLLSVAISHVYLSWRYLPG